MPRTEPTEPTADDLERARALVDKWLRVRAVGTHLGEFGRAELAGRIARDRAEVRHAATAEACAFARVCEVEHPTTLATMRRRATAL
jgi:hypothetical protein